MIRAMTWIAIAPLFALANPQETKPPVEKSPPAQEKHKEAGPDPGKMAASTAILVAELVQIDPIHYSGRDGSRFIFKITKVMKFEPDEKADDDQKWIFDELKRRCSDLEKYHALEFQYEYDGGWGGGIEPGKPRGPGDPAGKARHDELRKILVEKKRYILAAPSGSFHSEIGVDMDNKWGALLAEGSGSLLIEPATEEAIKKIEVLLKAQGKPDPK